MDAAACIGCGACVATCKNAFAIFFMSCQVSQINLNTYQLTYQRKLQAHFIFPSLPTQPLQKIKRACNAPHGFSAYYLTSKTVKRKKQECDGHLVTACKIKPLVLQ